MQRWLEASALAVPVTFAICCMFTPVASILHELRLQPLRFVTVLQQFPSHLSSHLLDTAACVRSRTCCCFTKLYTSFHVLLTSLTHGSHYSCRSCSRRRRQARIKEYVREYVKKAFLSLQCLFLLLPLLVLLQRSKGKR